MRTRSIRVRCCARPRPMLGDAFVATDAASDGARRHWRSCARHWSALPVLSVFASFWQCRRVGRHAAAPAGDGHPGCAARDVAARSRCDGRASSSLGATTAWLVAACDFRAAGSSSGRCCCRWRCRRTSSRMRTPTILQYAGPLQQFLARQFRLAARRLLVSRDSFAGGRGVRIHRCAVSVCVSACAHCISSAHGGDDGRGAQPRTNRVANVVARESAAGASCNCRGRAAGTDGNARRLWSGVLLRPANVYHVDLPRVVFARRPACGEPAGCGAAGAGAAGCFMSSIARVGAPGFLRRPRASAPRRALG